MLFCVKMESVGDVFITCVWFSKGSKETVFREIPLFTF